jgi:hypothetical protein
MLHIATDGGSQAAQKIISSFPDPAHIETRWWVYGKHLQLGMVSATIGDGGIGKSSLALIEAIAIATSRNLLGVRPRNAQGVLYWSGEEPLNELYRRVGAICQHYNIRVTELEGHLFIATAADFPIIIEVGELPRKYPSYGATGFIHGRNTTLAHAEDSLAQLRRFVRFNDIDVVIIDPFVACHRVPENDNMAIDAVVKTWAKFADQQVVAVELVHHTRKPPFGEAAEASVDAARGASAFKDAIRSVRALNRMTEGEAQRAGVDNHRSYFRAENGKANYALPPEGATWFKLISVLLPNGDEVDPGDEVGVVVHWKYPAPFDGVTEAHMLKVRAMAAEGCYRSDAQSPDWIGRAVADVLHLDADDDRARIKAILKTWMKNKVLKTVERKDETRHMKSFVEPGDWSET